MTLKLERNVKRFYDGLEEGVIYARKCTECEMCIRDRR